MHLTCSYHYFRLPLVIPVTGVAVKEALRKIPAYLCELLPLTERNIPDLWVTLQTELALEVFFYGRPLKFQNNNVSVNLGPGHQLENRSKTQALEFLALEDYDACQATESSLPDFRIWSSTEIVVSITSIINLM